MLQAVPAGRRTPGSGWRRRGVCQARQGFVGRLTFLSVIPDVEQRVFAAVHELLGLGWSNIADLAHVHTSLSDQKGPMQV